MTEGMKEFLYTRGGGGSICKKTCVGEFFLTIMTLNREDVRKRLEDSSAGASIGSLHMGGGGLSLSSLGQKKKGERVE